jgi:molybdopterin-containing oxidoreductase family iron-sulfur binding subunit
MSDQRFTENGSMSPAGQCSNATEERNAETPGNRSVLPDRRTFLAGAASVLGMFAVSSCSWQEFFQNNFRRMTKKEIDDTIQRLQAEYKQKYGKGFVVGTESPIDATLFGYACVEENNQSRDPQIQYIRVLRFKDGNMDLDESTIYYHPEEVPQPGYYYMPVQCQHCANPPCTKVCPVQATWTEPDGIVVVDYNWCIGCRYCMAACPYMGRWFNFADPVISADQINTQTHYLGNRPRMRNVVEKCTFCIQRVRVGKYPKCVEVCPVGARKFGNLLDPESEISRIIKTKRVFRLKEDLNTQPKFYYFFAT